MNRLPLAGILSPCQEKEATRAFTLVELIVVITILAILGTIAFISLQGYSKDARDSSRISDINHIKTSLELFSLDTGKYPLPDNEQDVTYSGTIIVWKQGKVGDTVSSQLSRNLNEKPTDPLYETEYIYSTLENGSKYEVMSVYEGDLAYGPHPNLSQKPLPNPPLSGEGIATLVSQANAVSIPTVRIDGTYNGLYVKTGNYIIPTPSIITSENLPMTLGLATIGSQVINRGTNIPNIGTSKVAQKTGELTFNNFQVYEGVINSDSSTGALLGVYNALADTYSGSSLQNVEIINSLLTQTTDDKKINFTKTVVLNTTVASTTVTQTCPTGYILVPGSSTFSTSDFCVAKYEMKNVSGVATSEAALTPWVSITQPQAITACNNLGTGYHLITNNEWMTIARNIEANSANWANGTLGSLISASGGLYRGNINLNDSASCGSNVVLDGNTPGTNCEVSGRNKRIHILSNGNEIWDISGNVREHVNGTNNISSTTGEVSNGNACSVDNLYSWNSINDGYPSCTFTNTTPTFYSKANHGPLGDYNANNGVGRIYSSTSTNRIFIRGGNWRYPAGAGVFALPLDNDSSNAGTGLGFRCAFSVN